MSKQRRELEHQEGLQPAAATYYYVQSPSPISHQNSKNIINDSAPAFLISPPPSHYELPDGCNDDYDRNDPFPSQQEASAAMYASLSRCSSSHGSNNSSFLPDEKKLIEAASFDHLEQGILGESGEHQRLVIIDEEDEWLVKRGRRLPWWWRYLSFGYAPSSTSWMALQIGWRMMVSAGVAILVFYMVTRPPSPHLRFKVGGVPAIAIGEGVDATGVAANIFAFNCTLILTVDNESKVYGLHIGPPLVHLLFGSFPLVTHRGTEGFYAGSDRVTSFRVYMGAKNKLLYGAGRNMLDMLESAEGLSLIIRISLRTTYRVLGGLINPSYRYQAECLLNLRRGDDTLYAKHAYGGTCNPSPMHLR